MQPIEVLIPSAYVQDVLAPEDRLFGANLTVEYFPNKTCREFLPPVELQANEIFDTYGCVTFSAWNSIETLLNFYMVRGMIPDTHLNFFIDEQYIESKDGSVVTLENVKANPSNFYFNFSDRFTVYLSGTMPGQGNSAKNVLTHMRKKGCVAEKVLPFLPTQGQYYSHIPQEIQDRAQRLLLVLEIVYQMIGGQPTPEQMGSALKFAPIHVSGFAWELPVNGIYQRTEREPNHMYIVFEETLSGTFMAYDHYTKSIKELARDYKFSWAQQNSFNLLPMGYKTFKGTMKNEVYVVVNGKYLQIGSWGSYLKGVDLKLWDKFTEVNQAQFDQIPKEPNSITFSL